MELIKKDSAPNNIGFLKLAQGGIRIIDGPQLSLVIVDDEDNSLLSLAYPIPTK
jgi:hypothetical protein